MTRKTVSIVLLICTLSCTAIAQQTPEAVAQSPLYNVTAFGAVGDGKTIDSPAINKTIEAAAAAGGGTVYFPKGTYLSFSIRLKSNIALYLDHGATILAADPCTVEGGYDPAESNPTDMYQDYGHSHWRDSLIWGEGIESISIIGPGLICGKGLDRWDSPTVGRGNKALALKLCRNVTIRDVTFLMGGHFCILATGVDNFTLDNVKMDTNRDGVNIDCCKNVRVSNCTVNSPIDDGICLKSSFGLGFARATENVTITNCQLSGYDAGTLLDGTYKRTITAGPDKDGPTGRIKFGTESNGGFKNVTISNCIFDNCRGLALETVDGGLLEDVSITNITMRDIVNAPIFLRLGSRMRGPEGVPVGKLRRVNISDIIVYNADPRFASIISGIPGHYIEDVRLNNIRIFYKGGGTKAQADLQPPENESKYPEPSMFGEIPAYGFFIRHVKGIELNDVQVSFLTEDLRPAFILEDVKNADFHRVKAQHAPDVSVFLLKNVEGFGTHQCQPIPDVQLNHVDRKNL